MYLNGTHLMYLLQSSFQIDIIFFTFKCALRHEPGKPFVWWIKIKIVVSLRLLTCCASAIQERVNDDKCIPLRKLGSQWCLLMRRHAGTSCDAGEHRGRQDSSRGVPRRCALRSPDHFSSRKLTFPAAARGQPAVSLCNLVLGALT